MHSSQPREGGLAPETEQMGDQKHAQIDTLQYEPPNFSAMEETTICCARAYMCLLCPLVCPCQLRVVQDYERSVKLRLGRRLHDEPLKGGMHLILPCGVDNLLTLDVRETVINVPQQNVVTKEGLSLKVDAAVYFTVFDASRALLAVNGVYAAISTLSQTKLREVLGMHSFDDLQVDRVSIANNLQHLLDVATDPWGISVTRVEIMDIVMPAGMTRAMGQEAEAQRNAKAKLIEAEGEKKASYTLKEAADVMAQTPGAMHLRFLQTLNNISAEQNSTIVVPFPSDLLSLLGGLGPTAKKYT